MNLADDGEKEHPGSKVRIPVAHEGDNQRDKDAEEDETDPEDGCKTPRNNLLDRCFGRLIHVGGAPEIE